jgi:hypothetical protein
VLVQDLVARASAQSAAALKVIAGPAVGFYEQVGVPRDRHCANPVRPRRYECGANSEPNPSPPVSPVEAPCRQSRNERADTGIGMLRQTPGYWRVLSRAGTLTRPPARSCFRASAGISLPRLTDAQRAERRTTSTASRTHPLSMKACGSSIASGWAASCSRYASQRSDDRRCTASSRGASDSVASRI